MSLDELKSRRKELVSLALTADCGDDYWNDVDEIDKQINRRYLKMNKEERHAKDYEKALEKIMTDYGPGESNLFSLIFINLKLLLEQTYNDGWDDGWKACCDFDYENAVNEALND